MSTQVLKMRVCTLAQGSAGMVQQGQGNWVSAKEVEYISWAFHALSSEDLLGLVIKRHKTDFS
jgi:hypothetical protein